MRRGFTMLEMLVVLAFMVIIVGVSIPAVTNIARSEAASELGIFNSFLKKTYTGAVRRGEYLRIVIDMQSGQYWAEKTETPFFLMTGKEQESYGRMRDEMLKSHDESERAGSLKAGSASGTGSFFELMMARAGDGAVDDDLYHWENFVPERRSVRELLKPEFTAVSEQRRLPSSILWSQFFAYHTPQIMTQETIAEEKAEKTAYIYFFPQGRISPFFLSIGEKDEKEEGGARTLLHIAADSYLRTRVDAGPFDEAVKTLFGALDQEGDEEGK